MNIPPINTTLYFFPDPHGSGASVAIEAESMEDALSQLETQNDQPAQAPTPEQPAIEPTPVPDAPEAVTESER